MKESLILFFGMILIISCEIPVSDALSTLNQFKSDMQKKIKTLVYEVQNLSNDSNQTSCNNIIQCQVKSYDECVGVGAKFCINWFPPYNCTDNTTDAYSSTQVSIGIPANKENSKNDWTNWTGEEKRFVCFAPLLNSAFNETHKDNNKRFRKSWFGSATGMQVRYPGQIRPNDASGTCKDYDPRVRPWYTAAISSAKFVVIIINSGLPMQNNNRFNIAKANIKRTLKTLSSQDYVLILSSSNDSISIGSKSAEVGNLSNLESFTSAIDNLSISNQPINYTRAFQKAFKLLDDSVVRPSCSQFSQLVVSFLLFSHEGQPNSPQDFQNATSIINSKNSSYQSRVFIFNIIPPSGQTTTYLQDLACNYNGASFKINNLQSDSDFFDHISFYYTILTNGVLRTQPIWTEVHQNYWGYGQVFTVSMPAYVDQNYIDANSSNTSIKVAIGVVAIDVPVSYFISLGINISEAWSYLQTNTQTCFNSTLDKCELEALRSSNNVPCNLNCSLKLVSSKCLPNTTTSKPFLDAVSTDNTICCPNPNPNPFPIVAVVVPIAIVLLIVILTVLYCKCRRKDLDNNEGNEINYLDDKKSDKLKQMDDKKSDKPKQFSEKGGNVINPPKQVSIMDSIILPCPINQSPHKPNLTKDNTAIDSSQVRVYIPSSMLNEK